MTASWSPIRVLTIAGTDPTGGAGVQADIKTITACGGYALSVVTAVVAQNTVGVRCFESVSSSLVADQLAAVASDTAPAAVKVGMLGDPAVSREVCEFARHLTVPLVVDPVMVATSGDELVTGVAREALWELLPLATLITPNIPELAVLSGMAHAVSDEELEHQARLVAHKFGVAVLAKGGHRVGDTASDVLIGAPGPGGQCEAVWVHAQRVNTTSTHGTGCSLSSAIATLLGRGYDLPEAVRRAKVWLTQAIRAGDRMAVGTGHGPLDHMWAAHDVFARAGDHGDAQDVASQWWADIMGIRHAIDELEFVQRLGNGTLPPEVFGWYVHQDSAYLREYSRALAMASTLAPTREEQELWARGAHSAIHVEAGMHHTWLAHAQMEQPVVTSQVTHGYVNHFLSYAARGDYEGLIAALLPCYWLYQDIGMRLYQRYWTSEHPYATWLATYHDEDFAAATAAVIDVVTTVAARADAGTTQRMRDAFIASAWWEHDFFAAPYRRAVPRGDDDEGTGALSSVVSF